MNKSNSNEVSFWNIFKTNEWIFLLIIITIGLMLRWINLTERPLHHDESLHAIYGLYVYDDPQNGYYKYNALLHGPLLYNVLPFVYDLFGTGKWAVRFLCAFLGSCFIFVPLLFRKYLQKNTLIFLITCISLSPTLVYWSRFIRHDFLAISSLIMALWGIVCLRGKYSFFPIIIGLVLPFAIKENAFVTAALLLGYLVFEFVFKKICLKGEPTSFSKIYERIKPYPIHFLAALLVAVFIYVLLYSAGFKYSQGILDGMYRESLGYWLKQHHIERIAGPFIYHLLMLSWYEFLFIIFTLIHMIHFYIKVRGAYLYSIITAILLAIIFHTSLGASLKEIHFIYKILKIKIPLDFYPYILIIIHALNVTIYHLKNKDNRKAFWGYFFFGTLFAYSFVGEKVPWLASYPLISGLIYISLYFEDNQLIQRCLEFKKVKWIPVNPLIIIFAILFGFTLKTSISTNFARAGAKTELISQVQTEKVFEEILFKINNEMLYPTKGKAIRLLALNAAWPTSWYFFRMPDYHFFSGQAPLSSYDYILVDPHTQIDDPNILQTHHRKQIPFRSWWVPPYEELTWGYFFSYLVTHNPINGTGTSYLDLYTLK